MIELSTRNFEINYHEGSVRWIKCNGKEILRMIYSAVRDRNWGTLAPEIISEAIKEDEQGFHIDVRTQYREGTIHFEADYRISGRANRLVFELEGVAKSTFHTNRTGLCVLHPIKECAGRMVMVKHPDGTFEEGVFPEIVAPHQPIKNISALEWQPDENLRAQLTFKGDTFEMEDQRNWTDASYKTYCRPLDLPFPFEIRKGERVWQKVELEIFGQTFLSAKHHENIVFDIDASRSYMLPPIGVSNTSRWETLTGKEAVILRSFPFDHLRCEIKLYADTWKLEWARAVGESLRLKVPLFAVLYFSENIMGEVEAFNEAVVKTGAKVKYILALGKSHISDDVLYDAVHKDLKKRFPHALTGTGVNAHFAELNRNRLKSKNAGFICFGVCPQVHAFDKESLAENLEGQKYVVESAREIFQDTSVFVSPITLKQRFNVVATAEEPAPPPDELPPQVDVRQSSVFAAQWLAVSIKFLAQAGARLCTYFETVGWRGLIQGDLKPPLSGKFPADRGEIFPIFQLLQELKGFNQVVHSESNSPFFVDGLVLRNTKTGEGKIIVVNFDSNMHVIKVAGIKISEGFRLFDVFSSLRAEGENITVPPESLVIFPLIP